MEKEATAFLNYNEGGAVFIGVDKTGAVVGLTDLDGDMLKIKDRLKNNILPSCMGLFDISAVEKDGKNVIKVTVASGSEKPYYIRQYGMSPKGCFIRVGTAAEPMSQKMIDRLFAKRTRNSIGKIRSPQQNLTFEQLRIYYQSRDLTLNAQFASNLELFTEEGAYNYVAYLMADKNGLSVKVAKYQGTNRVELIENNEYGYTSLLTAAKQVLGRFEVENRTISKITNSQCVDTRLWQLPLFSLLCFQLKY